MVTGLGLTAGQGSLAMLGPLTFYFDIELWSYGAMIWFPRWDISKNVIRYRWPGEREANGRGSCSKFKSRFNPFISILQRQKVHR